MAGKFITFEGGEGTGKSTQCARLAEALAGGGQEVCLTREPGGAPGAETIRQLLVTGDPGRWDVETEALLHYAARRIHLTETILPALQRNAWVVCDRFADSTLAYQGIAGGMSRAAIEAIHQIVVGGLSPDLTIVLDLPPEAGLARTRGRVEGSAGAEDRYERMGEAFHVRLREAFLEIAAANAGRCVVVDADAPVDEVQARIRNVVMERLGVDLPA